MSYCTGCGRIMAFGITGDGKKIPLDPKAPVYRIIEKRKNEDGTEDLLIERYTVGMVNHHSTCPATTTKPWKQKQEIDRTGGE